MSNTHPQPRQFAPNSNSSNHPNHRKRGSTNNGSETNFRPKPTNETNFRPTRIDQRNRYSTNNYNNNHNNDRYSYSYVNNNYNNSNNISNSDNNNANSNPNNFNNNNDATVIQNNRQYDNNFNYHNNDTNNNGNNSNNNTENSNTTNSSNNAPTNINENNNNENVSNGYPPLQCPLCNEKKFTYYSECIFHIISNHYYQAAIKKNLKDDCQCKYCAKLLQDDNEIIVQHMYDYHREDFFATILEVNRKKINSKLRPFLKQVLNVKEEPRVILKKIDENQISNYEEEQDDDYVNFIASSIHLNGLTSNDGVKIENVHPISIPNTQPEAEVIDHNFWVKLNNIVERLSNSGQIETSESKYYCYICNKDFGSHVKLLSHCWNEHQNVA